MASPKSSPNLFDIVGWQISTHQLRSAAILGLVRDPRQNFWDLSDQGQLHQLKALREKNILTVKGKFTVQADGAKGRGERTDDPRKTHSQTFRSKISALMEPLLQWN